jgi:hypothetical protein
MGVDLYRRRRVMVLQYLPKPPKSGRPPRKVVTYFSQRFLGIFFMSLDGRPVYSGYTLAVWDALKLLYTFAFRL